jgi:2-phospho-L-lactate guanylyltransferase
VKTAALVPFKDFTRAKQRLRERFSAVQVESLGRAMLEDVLGALRESSLSAVRALTEDPAVARVAAEAGAEVRLQRPDPGLNAALDAAAAELAAEGYEASLVVLGDLPLLEPGHVNQVLAEAERAQVVLVPSCDGGTAMLLRRPPACMPSRFGVESAAAHAAEARARGLTLVELGSLEERARFDLDTPEDVQRLLREPSITARSARRAGRTRELLELYAR